MPTARLPTSSTTSVVRAPPTRNPIQMAYTATSTAATTGATGTPGRPAARCRRPSAWLDSPTVAARQATGRAGQTPDGPASRGRPAAIRPRSRTDEVGDDRAQRVQDEEVPERRDHVPGQRGDDGDGQRGEVAVGQHPEQLERHHDRV